MHSMYKDNCTFFNRIMIYESPPAVSTFILSREQFMQAGCTESSSVAVDPFFTPISTQIQRDNTALLMVHTAYHIYQAGIL